MSAGQERICGPSAAWIDGRFYKYGESEFCFEKKLRSSFDDAKLELPLSPRKDIIHFTKKLLELPAPAYDFALTRLTTDYSMRAELQRNPQRAHRSRQRSIKCARMFLARHPEDYFARRQFLELLVNSVLQQAYGMSKGRWIEQGFPLPPTDRVVDQSQVEDVVKQVIATSGPFFPFDRSCLALALHLGIRTRKLLETIVEELRAQGGDSAKADSLNSIINPQPCVS